MSEASVTQPPGFTNMSKAEQIRYLQSLWDQIAERPGELPVPESHLDLAEERLKRSREDPTAAKSAFDVLDRLSRPRK
jgi:hypothetical protein